jgi:predicted nucleotidyltransferase component of viral defense system
LQPNPETIFDSGNVNFYISYGGPLGGLFGKKDLKVDITRNELICFETPDTPVFRVYSDLNTSFSILCYSKPEVLTEKMRSLMERTQPRDIYDLWYLLEIDKMEITEFSCEFEAKAKHKSYNPTDLVVKVLEKEAKYKSMWEKFLSNQIHDLPEFDGVFRDVMKNLRKL